MELVAYCTETGFVPFEGWYRALDMVAGARVSRALDRLRQGNMGAFGRIPTSTIFLLTTLA